MRTEKSAQAFSGKGTDVREDTTMRTKEKTETLIQLLAALRPAKFEKNMRKPQLAGLARTIAGNCAATIAFTERKLQKITEDNEEAFSLCELREEALSLKKGCAKLGRGMRATNTGKEVESLRLQYDNFVGSVRHVVGLLDRSLVEKLDEIL
jgi:hypothetical protein